MERVPGSPSKNPARWFLLRRREYLSTEPALAGLYAAAMANPSLSELLVTPLMLWIGALAFQGVPSAVIRDEGFERTRNRIISSFVHAALASRSKGQKYDPQHTLHWLSWLALTLDKSKQTVFYLEDLPELLPSPSLQLLCWAVMALNKIKYHYSLQELVIVTSLEAIDDLFRFKWGSAVKRLFDVKRARVDFLLKENDLQGRELAYITEAQQALANLSSRGAALSICHQLLQHNVLYVVVTHRNQMPIALELRSVLRCSTDSA